MRPIDEIILKTQRLKDLLAQVPEEPTYDTWMDQIHELLDDREQLLSAHGPDLEAADQTVIRQLVDDSQKIARLIEAEHQRLAQQIGSQNRPAGQYQAFERPVLHSPSDQQTQRQRSQDIEGARSADHPVRDFRKSSEQHQKCEVPTIALSE